MKKILVADDHTLVRKGLIQLLLLSFPDFIFDEASNSSEVLRKIKKNRIDLLILDFNMPGRTGLEVLNVLKRQNNKIPVLVVSLYPEEFIALRVLKAGAWGYLEKDASESDLVKAVSRLLSGKKFFSPRITEQVVSQLDNNVSAEPHELLSDREFQTFLLIASGKTVSQIAAELSLSIPTISTYRSRILLKMKMKTNAELTNYAFRHKLV